MSNKMRAGTWLLALAACAVLVGGTTAQADPVRFDNPTGSGHFEWYSTVGDPEIRLDVLLPADQQVNIPLGDTAINQQVASNQSSLFGSPVLDLWTQGSSAPDSFFLETVGAGDPIPAAGTDWKNGTAFFWREESQYEPLWGPQFPEGQTVYIGLRFDLGGGYQYGWLEVVRGGGSLLPQQLDVLAWGYETEVGVPIAAGVPEPGTLAMLAIGAVGVLRRRRA